MTPYGSLGAFGGLETYCDRVGRLAIDHQHNRHIRAASKTSGQGPDIHLIQAGELFLRNSTRYRDVLTGDGDFYL